jgi:hypothetical protein
VALEFADAKNAARFERYLKTGSGRAFAKRHFGPCAEGSLPGRLRLIRWWRYRIDPHTCS